jgi:hypothetical protein
LKKDEKLKEVEEAREKAEGARKEAEDKVEKSAKELEDSCAALLACMQEAKVAVDVAFVKGGAEPSGVLPDVDPSAFSAWLQAELG